MDAPAPNLHIHITFDAATLSEDLQNVITQLLQDNSAKIEIHTEPAMAYSQLSSTGKTLDDIPVPPSELPVALSEIWLNRDARRELGQKLGLNRYDIAILTRMTGSISQAIRFKQSSDEKYNPPWSDRLPDELLGMSIENGRGLRADYFVRVAGYTKIRRSTLRYKSFNMGPKSEEVLHRVAMYLFQAYS